MKGLRVTVLGAALALAGCASPAAESEAPPSPMQSTAAVRPASPTTPGGTAVPRTSRSSAAAPAQVPAILRFKATTVGGKAFDGASLAGKPTLLWFWAPWCPSCRGQIGQVEAIQSTYGDRVNVVGVGSLDSAEAIRRFAGDVAGVIHLSDQQGEVWKRFKVTEQSSFVLLDAGGQIAFRTGYGGSDQVGNRVGELAE